MEISNNKKLALSLPIEEQCRLAECLIKKEVNQEWFLDLLFCEDTTGEEFLFETCDAIFIGNLAYISMFNKSLEIRQQAKGVLDRLKSFYKNIEFKSNKN